MRWTVVDILISGFWEVFNEIKALSTYHNATDDRGRLFWPGPSIPTSIDLQVIRINTVATTGDDACPDQYASHLWNGPISPLIAMPPRLRMHRIHIRVPTSHRWLKCPAHAAMAMVVPPLSLPRQCHGCAMVVSGCVVSPYTIYVFLRRNIGERWWDIFFVSRRQHNSNTPRLAINITM